MQKLFALAAIAAATQALNLHQSEADFAEVMGSVPPLEITEAKNADRPQKEPRHRLAQHHARLAQRDERLAQTSPALDFAEQYSFQCSDVFNRVLSSANPDAPALIAAGSQWSDPTYTPEIANFQNFYSNTPYYRISNKFPTSAGWQVFQNNSSSSVSVNDVVKGYLWDDGLTTVLAGLAAFPAQVYNMFDVKTANAAGVYSVKLNYLGVPISVVVDDFIDYDEYYQDTFYWWTNPSTKQLWPLILQKAASKLLTNYDALEKYDDPLERGMQLLGTGGSWWYTSSYTASSMYTLMLGYYNAGHIVTGMCYTGINNLSQYSYYTVLGTYKLSNKVNVVKLRNPYGLYGYEWTGAYGDADPIWTSTITAASKSAVGYTNNGNDGVFFMSMTDFKANFQWVDYTYNPTTTWKQAYWMALGDGNTVGTTGTTSYCGSTCKRTVFDVTSTVAQSLYISASLPDYTQYYQDPCTQAADGATWQYVEIPGYARLWDYGSTSFAPITVTAGQTISVITEFDWNRPNIRNDFSVSIWGTSAAVTIKERNGKASAKNWIYGDPVNPAPVPPQPTPENCSGAANKFVWGTGKSAIVLSNGCNTRAATISVTMPTTSWGFLEQTDAGHANATCTTSGSNKTCNYAVATGGVSQQAVLLFGTAWDGVFTSSVALA